MLPTESKDVYGVRLVVEEVIKMQLLAEDSDDNEPEEIKSTAALFMKEIDRKQGRRRKIIYNWSQRLPRMQKFATHIFLFMEQW